MKIVMYHYVRPIAGSRYPKIKGLELESFRRQLDYLMANYRIVGAEEVLECVRTDREISENSVWLTFDDGYKDHIKHVLPELLQREISGTFFPPAGPSLDGQVLDVNAIHFILAKANNEGLLLDSLERECLESGISEEEYQSLWTTIDKSSRYDTEGVIFFKRVLQNALPYDVRTRITKKLFREFVKIEYPAFCKELYMSLDDIQRLFQEGMTLGSHTYNHFWLNKLSISEQKIEIDRSLAFLRQIGVSDDGWIMCYPYGTYNDDTLKVLSESGCAVGVTTEVGDATTRYKSRFTMKRFDTNDFPQ